MATTIPLGPKQHELAFIVSNSLEKPDQNARQLIRRHVMRHKNQRKRAVDRPRLRSWINQESCSQHSQLLSNSAVTSDLYFPRPMQLGTDLPLTQFAYNMPPYALDLVFKWTISVFTVVGQAMYPIQLCLLFDVKNSIWIEYLAVDALYCHSVLWMAQAYFDWLKSPSGLENSYIQIQHAHKTLRILQQRLTDSRLATSNVTICVVTAFVMMTALVGNHELAMKHMMGLYKLVELRGGVRTLMHNGQIQLKVCRADVTMALLTDNKPMFFSDADISWKPYIAQVQNTSTSTSHTSLPLPNSKHFAALDIKLSYIWADLQEFTRSANLAFQTRQKMDCTLFQEILVSVQYRLILLDLSTSSGSLDQVMHMGMLAFSTNIFLQTHGLAIRFEKLSTRLRDSILRLRTSDLENDNSIVKFKMWLLFVARMFTVGELENEDSDDCCWLKIDLKKTLEALDLTEWKDVRDRLKGYLWIDVLHDDDGKKAFGYEGPGSSEAFKGYGSKL